LSEKELGLPNLTNLQPFCQPVEKWYLLADSFAGMKIFCSLGYGL